MIRSVLGCALVALAPGRALAADPPRFADVARSPVEMHAVFSPDGRSIAYTSNRNGNDDVFVEPLDGSSPPKAVTTHAADDRFPSFSPDGRLVAFQSARNGNWDVFVIAIGEPDETARVLAQSPANDVFPAFSPDGKSVLFGSDRDTGKGTGVRSNFDLHMVPLEGGAPTIFEGSADREWCVSFSRDGATALLPVVAEAGPAFVGRVLVKDVTTGMTRVPSATETPALPGGFRTEAAFSSGGDYFVATVLEDGASRFRFIETESGDVRTPPEGLPAAGSLTGPAFSPDGRLLAFVHSSLAVPPAIHLLDLASGAVRRLHAPERPILVRERLERFRSKAGDIDVPAWLVTPASASAAPVPPRAAVGADDPALLLSSTPPSAARPPSSGARPAAAGAEAPPAVASAGLVVLIEGSIPRYAFSRADLWRPDVQFLAESGFSVLVVHPRGSRGFGFAHLAAFDPKLEKGALDVLAAIEAAARFGYGPASGGVSVLAESWGSLVALPALASAAPGAVRAAALLSPATDLEALLAAAPYFEVLAEETFGAANDDAGKAALRAISPLSCVPRLGMPLLVAHGAKDEVIPVEQSRELRRAFESAGRAAAITYLEYPDAPHGLSPRELAETMERVRSFFGRDESGRAPQ